MHTTPRRSPDGHTGTDLAWLDLDMAGLLPHLEEYAETISGLIGDAADRFDEPVPGLDWTVGDLVAHLVTGATNYGAYLSGIEDVGYDLADMTTSNQTRIESYGEATAHQAANDYRDAMTDIVRRARDLSSLDPMPWHVGTPPAAVVVGLLLNECLIHGRDLARALGRRWTITDAAAVHGVRAAMAVASHIVDRDAAARRPASYRMLVKGSPASLWTFDTEGLTVVPDRPGRVSCTVAITAPAVLLVSYGRVSPLAALATGRVVAWGRRPWASFRLPSYLVVG